MSNPTPGTGSPDGEPTAQAGGKPRPGFAHPGGERSLFVGAVRRYAVGLLILSTYAFCALAVIRGVDLSIALFHRQDVPVIGVTVALLLCISAWPRLLHHVPLVRIPPFAPALLLGFALVIAASGTWLVFDNFDLSRDEFMANFDADVFASGRLAWPIPTEWRPFSRALMPLFMRGIPVEAGWISDYLPGNALLRALAERTIGREFASPILAAVAAFALFRIARKLWPETPRSALVPVLLLTASPQFLIMAMTPFAMTAHLAFNLLWLLCFLQNNRRGDAGALACGFVATGLHQLVFHPLFAAPFVAELLLARRFRRAALFIAGYGLICLFWVLYPQLFEPLPGTSNLGGGGTGAGLVHLVGTAKALLGGFELSNILLMLLNLLRFAAWQHLLLLVLVSCAWPAVKRAQGIARPLLAGVALLLIVTFLLMPWQGNGWGYRYLHGFLGSFCLLAGYGWHRLARFSAERRAALTLATAATVGLILPFQMVSTHAIVAPYRAASVLVQATKADVVLVDGSGMQFGVDVVRNTAALAQRPKVMDMRYLTRTDLRDLCARYDVRVFDRRHSSQVGIPLAITPDVSGARAILPAIGCDNPLPLSRTNETGSGQ